MGDTIQSLENKYQYLDSQYKSVPKRKWMFRLATLAFVVLSFFMYYLLGAIKDKGIEKSKTFYFETENVDILEDYFNNNAVRGNAEAMARLEEFSIGIPNNIALSGLSKSCYVNVNYLNVIGDLKVWRNVKTGRLKVVSDGKSINVGTINVGEVIASKERIYYIDTKDDSLSCYLLGEGSVQELITEPIDSFAVVGNQLFALSKEGTILRYSVDGGQLEEVVTNVQRFYLAGNLIVQNSDKIYSIGLDGKEKTELISHALLVGADYQYVYFTDFGVDNTKIADKLVSEADELGEDTYINYKNNLLYALNIDNNEIKVIRSSTWPIRGVYSIKKGVVLDLIK